MRIQGDRVAWVLVGATIFTWCFLLFGYNDSYPWLALAEVGGGLFAMAVVGTALSNSGKANPAPLGASALIVSTILFFIWCWIQIRIAPSYGTDEAAFDQYAAQLFVHGQNPYAASMAPSFSIFHVSPDGFTFRLNGTPVTQLSYPALSFLLYAPLLLVGVTSQAAILMNVVGWALAIAIAYFLLPREFKPLAIVLGSFVIFTGFAVGGVTDALYVPFLIIAVYRWDRFINLSGWQRWVSPAAMGLSLGIKQTPWFIVPFLVIGLYLEKRLVSPEPTRPYFVAWQYLWRLLVVFLIPNLYFIAINPSAWFRGILTPFIDHLVPAGEGIVAIANFMGRGGGLLAAYSALSAAMLLFSIVIFVNSYPRSKGLLVFIPSLILFFSERSFSNYFVMFLLPAVVAASSLRGVPETNLTIWANLRKTGRRQAALALSLLLVFLSLALVTMSPQPISLHVISVSTTGQLATVIRTKVSVTNRTNHVLTPVFTSEGGGAITAPWLVIRGPRQLRPGATTIYRLQAPNFPAQPALSGGFQMVALTTSPAAMSVSAPFTPTFWHVALNPQAFNKPIPVNQYVTFAAQVLSPTDNPVNVAGIPVYLGQISYTQQGLSYTEAVINSGAQGQSPVKALTNSHGVAFFTLRGTVVARDPVYFEANLVNGQSSYPYGYSNIVPILFSPIQ